MNRITAALLVLVMVLCLAACGEQIKTETIYVQTSSVRELQGQEIRMEYTYSDHGEPVSVKTYFNDQLYQTTSTRTSNGVTYLTITDAEGNSSTQTTTTQYDDNGNVTMIEISVAGNTVSRTTYTYDENGNMLSAINLSTVGTVVAEYTYDANGNVLKQVETDESTGEVIATEYTYDERNYVLTERIYDGEGVLQEAVEYAYESDDSGRTLTYFDGDGAPTGEVVTCVYDEHGNMIEQTTTLDGEVIQRITYTYEALEVPVEDAE